MSKRLTTEEFIIRARAIHGDKYNYDLVEYVDMYTPVIIQCNECGKTFSQIPNNHLTKRKNNNGGCTDCYNKHEFLNKANKLFNNLYDYSLMNYKGMKDSITIICTIHGEFTQIPSNHLLGYGCSFCSGMYLTTEMFIEKAKKIHGDKYDYSKTNYIRSNKKVEIICPIHGPFWQRPNDHLSGCGCSSCNDSKGEEIIDKYLRKNNYNYKSQFRFKDCRNKNPLPFDFAIFSDKEKSKLKYLIEFDGELHYEICRYISRDKASTKLKKCQSNDNIKNEYCIKNDITLIRIPYWERNNSNIENILDYYLF
jgi:hypothetical protein